MRGIFFIYKLASGVCIETRIEARAYFFFKKEYAWILSRTRTLKADEIKLLVEKLKNYTNIENLFTTDQTNC